ncbi:hypothetical protein V6N11_031342 [Hibiscus sabdariffa]|uniref:Uncharacterized protein n=1 Tax=Hibiscus sabdariffa TaxID=183260 RepID=A0ABR2SXX4_9ROSI
MVPKTVSIEVVHSSQIHQLWERNKREDWCVLEASYLSRDWSNEEEAGLVPRGKAGGILIISDTERFRLLAMEMVSRFVVIEGIWIKDDWHCEIIEVYTPCGVED